MTYRDDLHALSARHAALESEVAQKTRELDQASQLLDEARAKTRLPVLANIRVAAPCTADWAAMTGDERARLCGDCNKQVFNLSELTRDEAEALIREKAGRLCVSYFQRKDGTILLADCAIGVSRTRRRRAIAIGAAALLAGGGALGYQLNRGVEAEVGQVEFAEPTHAAPAVREVQGVEPPPDEIIGTEVIKIIGQPIRAEYSERTLGAVVVLPEDLENPLAKHE